MSSGSADGERDSITFRLSSEKKQKWISYLSSDSPHSTLTDLIKTSVDNRIDSKWVLVDENEDADTSNMPDELDDSLESITQRLTAIETRLDKKEIAGSPDDGKNDLEDHEVQTLAIRIHDRLPVVADADHLKSLTEYDVPTLNPDIRASITGTAQDISAVMDRPEHHIRTALIFLERQESTAVESIIHNDTRRWYEADPRVDREPPSSLEIKQQADVNEDDVESQLEAEVGSQDDTE
jgi:hypothetical protein